jgi:uncharacterized protein involved in exopolysaccharide biosynthesis
MAEKRVSEFDFNSVNFLWFLWKWKWVLMIVALTAGVLAAIFSGPRFITPMYKSVVVLFPTSTNSISKAIMDEISGGKEDLMSFGEEAEAEQMIQILNSSQIRDRIIQRYNLMHHYEIKPNSKFATTELNRTYSDNIRFRRTEYKGVEIKVMDHSADTAMLIANDIAEYFDTIKNDLQKQRAMEGLAIVEAEFLQMQQDIFEDEDSLRKLRELGVYDYEGQVEMINQQLAIELARGKQSGIKALTEKLDTLAKYGGAYVSLRDALEYEKKNFSDLRKAYKKARVDAQSFMPQKFVVDRAYKAEKKSYPVRWLIVVISMFSTFLVTIIALIVIENVSRISATRQEKNLPAETA